MFHCVLDFLPLVAILAAAVLCGYWLGRFRLKRPNAPVPGAGDANEEEIVPTPVECVHSDQLANAAVNSSLYHFDKLNQLAVAGCWQVRMECNASENYCRVTTETKLRRFVKVESLNDGLLIRYTGKRRPTLPMTIELKTTGLPAKIKGIGANSIVVENVDGNALCCKVSDNGRLVLRGGSVDEFTLKLCGSSQAECRGKFVHADLDVSGASTAAVSGRTGSVDARISGASKLNLATAERAELEVSGASKVRIDVDKKLTGDVAGSSTVKYSGKIACPDMRVSSSSKVKPVAARRDDAD